MSRLNQLVDILDKYIEFLAPYRQLLNAHNVNFLLDEHWFDPSIIAPDLRNELDEMVVLRSSDDGCPNLVKRYAQFAESTDNNSCLDRLFSVLNSHKDVWSTHVLTPVESLFTTDDSPDDQASATNKKRVILEGQNRFMNEKKTYEVDLMSEFVAYLCTKLNIKTIVDIGSGRAYLSAQLSSALYAFDVVAIDSSPGNVESSMKRVSKMKRSTNLFTSKQQQPQPVNAPAEPKEDNSSRFRTFSQFIQSSTELMDLIRSHGGDGSGGGGFDTIALVGLHSCGNLSNSIVNLHLDGGDGGSSRLLCNVACCYNLMNEKYARRDEDEMSSRDLKHTQVSIDDASKFPMSAHLNASRFVLNFNARMLACHSLDRCLKFYDDFKELNSTSLWYRSVLQVLILERFYEPIETSEDEAERRAGDQCRRWYVNKRTGERQSSTAIQLGRNLIREKAMPSFVDYCRKALAKLGLQQHDDDSNLVLSEDEIDAYMRRFEASHRARFNLYIQLKMLLSPIVEYVILLDRLVYLFEKSRQHHHHHLVRLFDPSISPRCHALISY